MWSSHNTYLPIVLNVQTQKLSRLLLQRIYAARESFYLHNSLLTKVLAQNRGLGSARKGLIFIRSQKGTQPGWLTQTGQTQQGIRYHVPSCLVPVGELAGGKWVAAPEVCGALGNKSYSVHFAAFFVSSAYQYYCCYCLLHLLFC